MPSSKVFKVRPAAPAEFNDVAAFCAGKDNDAETATYGRRRRAWLEEMAPRGLKVVVAVDDAAPATLLIDGERVPRDDLTNFADGLAVGLLEYVPIEHTLYAVAGEGYLFVDCLWVIPPYLGRGVGRALLAAVIREARHREAGVAVVAWRGPQPYASWAFMPAAFFAAAGFEVVAADGDRALMTVSYGLKTKPAFVAAPPRDETAVEYLCHPSCPASMRGASRVGREAAARRATDIVCHEITGRDDVARYGALFGVCRAGRPAVNRLAFWREVAAVAGIEEELGASE